MGVSVQRPIDPLIRIVEDSIETANLDYFGFK